MQVAFAALGSLFGGGGAAAGAGAAAAGTAAAAGGFGSTALTVLQGVTATISALGQIGAGNAAAQASEDEAIRADLQAGQEKVDATNQQTQMKQELMRILGENEVAAANAGIDISAGIAQQANSATKRDAQTNLTVSRNDQEFQSALFRLRAKGLRRKADSQRQAGLLNAFGTAAGFGIDLFERG
ncbi:MULTISPECIES: hypothetical protein [Stappiaceae]|uniref:hypothetical protein n=1 Tax=Stappiaceae TaxID=2821832 RepID=UPI0004907ACA|nr:MULTISPECIES: hypothetical protein [Stappiaceae]